MPGETNIDESVARTLWEQMDLSWWACCKFGVIILLCWALLMLLKRARQKLIHHIEEQEGRKEIPHNNASALKTIIPLGASVLKCLCIFVCVLMGLSVLHISVSPFVYLLGFASMGISLGAQDTFADIIKGILTLLEGKIAVGDTLIINGSKGRVREIGIRQLILGHPDGSIEVFPYSKIGTVQNFSKAPTTMMATFKLSPSADTREFEAIVLDVLKELRENPLWKPYFLAKKSDHPDIFYDEISNRNLLIEIRLTIKNDPGKNFVSEFNRRMIAPLQKAQMLELSDASKILSNVLVQPKD